MTSADRNPRSLKSDLRRAFAALNAGQLETAGALCRSILQRAPELPQGHFLVGLLGLESQDRKTAFQAFASVTRLDPTHAAAWAQLARLLQTDGQFDRADQALAEAVRHAGDDPIVLDLIGSLYSLGGEHGQARRYFERAVARAPEQTGYMLNLANNRIYFGDLEAGVELLERLLVQAPRSPQAHWVLANTRTASDTSHIERMLDLVAGTDHPRAQAFFWYAIGKCHEDLAHWDEAASAFCAGAAARRRTLQFDEAAEVALFETLENTFTEAWRRQANRGSDESGPVFILGQPRTGTTLIERVLSAHSAIHAAGELQQFPLAVRRLTGHTAPQRYSATLVEQAARVDPARLGQAYLSSARRVRGDTPLFIDKLPQNYLLLPLIATALPGSHIIHLTRHPADACVASFKQLFADAYLHSYEPGEMARHHLRYRTLLDRWRERFDDAFLEVHYEAAAADLEPQARRLIRSLALPWEAACLRFYEQPTAVTTASAVQVREPAHTRSVGQWQRYEQHLAPMFDTLVAGGLTLNG
ncbi:MAG: sulfotransferase [Pseudomonadota bacterium]